MLNRSSQQFYRECVSSSGRRKRGPMSSPSASDEVISVEFLDPSSTLPLHKDYISSYPPGQPEPDIEFLFLQSLRVYHKARAGGALGVLPVGTGLQTKERLLTGL